MEELTSKLKREMDRTLMGNDQASLRQLVGMLNNPAITGAVVPPEEKLPSPPVLKAAPAQPRVAERVRSPVDNHPPAQKMVFTGHPCSGKSYLASAIKAREFGLDDPIHSMLAEAFGTVLHEYAKPFISQVRAWGEGVINDDFQLTPERALFVDFMRRSKDGSKEFGIDLTRFGTEKFWLDCLIARVDHFLAENPADRVVVTDVSGGDQLQVLRTSGFRSYHVACSPAVRKVRGAGDRVNSVALAVEQDITNKLSRQPSGGKLWCIWNDDTKPMPSARLMSVTEFIGCYSAPTIANILE